MSSPASSDSSSAPRIRWIVSGLVLCGLFIALGVLVSQQPLALDVAVRNAVEGQWQRAPGRVAATLSDIFGPVLTIVFGSVLFVVALWSWRQGQRERFALLLRLIAVLTLCRLTSLVAKPIFVRERPREYPDLSYPSGHVTAVASTAFVAVLLCLWLAPHLARWILLIAVVSTTLAAANRIVFGVHWLTDTVGAVLGVLGVGLAAAAALRLLPPPTRPDANLSNGSESVESLK